MIMCGKCGGPLEETVRYCSGCGARAPGWDGPEVNPLPPEEKESAPNPPTPPVDSEKDGKAGSHPYEERLKDLEHSIRGWINQNRRLSLMLSVLGLVTGIASLWFVGDFFKARKSPPPDAIFIEVEKGATEVEAGRELRITARLSPVQNVPGDFRWEPAEMIEGNGQQSVVFKPPKDQRHTPYAVIVSLKTYDRMGNTGPAAEAKSITVLPEGQTNHKPYFEDYIQIKGESHEAKAGSLVSCDALAVDQDGDKLTYSWSVDISSVQIEGDGTRKVSLKLPQGLARRGNVNVKINLRVSDGKLGEPATDWATLTVTPSGQVSITRTPRKPKSPALTNGVRLPTPTAPLAPTSTPPLAVPLAPQSGAKPEQVSRPNQ